MQYQVGFLLKVLALGLSGTLVACGGGGSGGSSGGTSSGGSSSAQSSSLPTAPTLFNLTKLPGETGVPDWATYRGNAQRTGYVPIAVNIPNISKRWSAKPWGDGGDKFRSSLATGKGKVFIVSYATKLGIPFAFLYAINEQDGSLAWEKQLSEYSVYFSPGLAVSDGVVYVAAEAQGYNLLLSATRRLWAFDATSGELKYEKTTDGTGYPSPLVANGKIYLATEFNLDVYDAATGERQTEMPSGLKLPASSSYGSFSQWPVLAGKYLYGQSNSGVVALSPNNGWPLTSWPADFSGFSGVAVATQSNGLLVNLQNGTLSRLSLENPLAPTTSWSVQSGGSKPVVIAGGTLYLLSTSDLRMEARSESNGNVLWSWSLPPGGGTKNSPETFTGSMAVTNNVLFLTTNYAAYGIDLATHQTVFKYTTGVDSGFDLAISSQKVLYLQNSYYPLQAFNLF